MFKTIKNGLAVMHTNFATVDRLLTHFSQWKILLIAVSCIAIIATVDYVTGYDVSVSIFYLVPVAVASWYSGRHAGISIAVLACISWFTADIAAGHQYVHQAIPVWNALVRLGFFLITGLLVVALRDSIFHQRQLARTDDLTGIFGRRAFEERLEHDLDLSRRNGSPLTLAFLDLDNFKILNDTPGHVAGDQALRVTAQVLQSARRADTVARLGGDEFALVLPDTTRKGAEEVIANLMHDLQEALRKVTPGLTCCIGAITFEDTAPQLEEAVHAADALMYQAKREGKNRVVFSVVTKGMRKTVKPDTPTGKPETVQ